MIDNDDGNPNEASGDNDSIVAGGGNDTIAAGWRMTQFTAMPAMMLYTVNGDATEAASNGGAFSNITVVFILRKSTIIGTA